MLSTCYKQKSLIINKKHIAFYLKIVYSLIQLSKVCKSSKEVISYIILIDNNH